MCDNKYFHNNKGVLDGLTHKSAHEGIFQMIRHLGPTISINNSWESYNPLG